MAGELNLGDLKITLETFEDAPVKATFDLPDGSIVTRQFPNTGELTMKLGLGLGLNVVQSTGGPSVEAPVNTVLPAISGDAISGKTLSVTDGTWDDGGAAISGYTYQWKDDGVAIGGATANTFLLTDTQIGGVITCTVTATNSAGSTDATSGGTAAVVAALSISGTPVLTATEDSAYAGFTATGAGGESPYVYSLVGTWPAGISINSGTGAVSGTPTEIGSFASLSVRVTDNNLDTADLDTFTLEVEAAGPSFITARYWSINIASWGGHAEAHCAEIEFALLGQAKHTPVSASATDNFAGFPASNAIDGDKSTSWVAANSGTPKRLTLDFGSAVDVNVVRILGRTITGYLQNFTVDYRNDPSDPWVTGWTVTGAQNSFGVDVAPFPLPSAVASGKPLWRVDVSASDGGTALSIAEIEWRDGVGGTDLTGSGKPWARRQLDTTNVASKAFDNDDATFWHSTSGSQVGQVGYEFSDGVSPSAFALRSRVSSALQAPEDFKAQSSEDGVTWTDERSVTGQTGWASGGETREFTIP